MGGPNRGGRGTGNGQKAPQNQNHKKKTKKSANGQKETNSESSDSDISKKSSEDLSREADLETIRQQTRGDYVTDEIFIETGEGNEVSENHNLKLNPVNASDGFLAAPGDERRNQAKMITKRSQSTKRRRHSMDEDTPISGQIFNEKSIEEQTVIVVNNLSTDIDNLRLAYLKESKEIRGVIKSDQAKRETTAVTTANKIEALNATINELKAEAQDGKKNVHDLVTAVQALSTMVEEQNSTIKGLVTGNVDLKDTTDLQHKINDTMKVHLESISKTVVKYSDRNLGVTQSRCHEIKTATNKIQNELEKSLKTNVPREKTNNETIVINEEISNMTTSSSNFDTNERSSSSGANFDGSHNVQKLKVGGQRPGKPPPPKSYANTTKTGTEAGLPVGAPPTGQKYNHKQNNKATFDRMEAEGPTMVRRDYATFPDGNIKWNEHYEPKKPELTEQQKQRRKTKWEKDKEKTEKEVLIFMIPTRDAEGRIHTREYDNAQVIRLFKELARGGYFLKHDDIAGSTRQIQNDRHPQHVPLTVTCKDKETAENVITAASNIYLNGGRRAKPDDEEKGRFGYFRPSLTERERMSIKEKKRQRETLHGKGQAEIRKRKFESHTGAEEWADLIKEELNLRMANAANDDDMGVVDTEGPKTPTRTIDGNQDENLNRISPPATMASTQSTQDKENEKLRKQLEELTKRAESMAELNDQFRQRNAALEEQNKKKA